MADHRTVVEEVGRDDISTGDTRGMPGLSIKTNVNGKTDKMTTTSNHELSPQEVEELVRRLTMNEMKTKWFVDEIVSKVKTELVESPQAKSPMSSGPLSPQPNVAQPRPRLNKYQATVEDAPDSLPEEPTLKPHTRTAQDRNSRPLVHNYRSPSSDVSEESSKASNPLSSTTTMRTEPIHTPTESPQPSPKSRPTVRFSDRVPVILHNLPVPQPRHSAPNIGRPVVNHEPETKMSAVDLKWGKLFNERCEPTPRLYQFLKGLAKFIAAEYTPRDSMVVTPEKLSAFYSRFKLESESYPFRSIFEKTSRRDCENLEDLYLDLKCQYYLVHSRPDSKSPPNVPGLTPLGFADWMIQHIQAFPDQEAKRLDQIVAELPVEAEGTSERLPKRLSRHLLPAERQRSIHEKVVHAGNTWLRAAGYSEPSHRRDSREKTYKSSRKSSDHGDRDVIVSRSTGDSERKSGRGSGHRRKSRDDYSKSNERVYHRPGPSSRNMGRTASEQITRYPRDNSPPPQQPNYRQREPVNHYRSSVPAVNLVNDNYSLYPTYDNMASSYQDSTYSGGSLSGSLDRSLDYMANHIEASRNKPSSTPRASKRHSLVVPGRSQDSMGPTYEKYSRSSPQSSRNGGVEDGSVYL